ncbi:MAG: hypothetical protein Q9222_007379 [Ikaeria aurantiellina]
MDAPRLLVLIFLLLFLYASPDTQNPSPSQQRHLDKLVAQEQHALNLLGVARYGDLSVAEKKWINVTGLRKSDGYSWDLLPDIQERARQQANRVIDAWYSSVDHEKSLIHNDKTSNITDAEVAAPQRIPFYQNVTSIVHGHWIRSKIAKGVHAPVVNLTALVPQMTYMTDRYTRNITGLEGELRFKLDEKQSETWDSGQTPAREISAEMTIEDQSSSGDGWEMTLHGVHYPLNGSIVLTTTSQRMAGIFALPHLATSPAAFDSARELLNETLAAAIKTQKSASETNALSPWSSSPNSPSDLLFPTPHCEYVVYLQQHPIQIDPSEVESIESELRDPAGLWNSPSPQIKMSAIIFSPDCGFVLESKGPPDFAPRPVDHLQGPKVEVYIRSSRRTILTFALVLYAQIYLLLRQMREASTPSTRSRISYYTIAMMALGDGFVCISFLVISILIDAIYLPMAATASLAFVCVSFFAMRFVMDIWTVQGPEREEQRRQRDRDAGTTTSNQGRSTSAPNTAPTTTGADTLPPPVTAPQPAPTNIFEAVLQPRQVPNPAPNDPTNGTPAPATPINTGRRELSALYVRFYLLLVVLVFLTMYSLTWPPVLRTIYARLLSATYLSFHTPQIYRNIMRNCRKALQWRFVAGQSLLRVLPFAYFYLYSDNILFVKTDTNWTIVLLGWLWFQVCILVSQELFGPRYFVPKACNRWIPTAYEYHPILREEDEESGASMPIGYTQHTSSAPEATIGSSSTKHEPYTEQNQVSRKGSKSFDCAISVQSDSASFGTSNRSPSVEMLLLRILLLTLSVGSIHTSSLNVTDTISQLRKTATAQSQPNGVLPNPYHVPESDVILDFYEFPVGPIFPRANIIGLLDKARDDAIAHFIREGNARIPVGTQVIKYAGHAFVYECRPPDRIMRYGDLLSVIRGFHTKERLDGYKHRLATVMAILQDGRVVQSGDAALVETVMSEQ